MQYEFQDPNVKKFAQWLKSQSNNINLEDHLATEEILVSLKDGRYVLGR
jgi:hypothetical protein